MTLADEESSLKIQTQHSMTTDCDLVADADNFADADEFKYTTYTAYIRQLVTYPNATMN